MFRHLVAAEQWVHVHVSKSFHSCINCMGAFVMWYWHPPIRSCEMKFDCVKRFDSE